jgi:hypothetical protein
LHKASKGGKDSSGCINHYHDNGQGAEAKKIEMLSKVNPYTLRPGVTRPALFFILILPLPAYAAQKGACCPHLGKQGKGRLLA